MFREKRTKPCKGETQAVKFQAQVLGQKNPPFYDAPTGLAIVLRPKPRAMPWAFTGRPVGAGTARFVHGVCLLALSRRGSFTASACWRWAGVVRPRRLPVGAGKAWFVTRRLPVGLEARHPDGTFSKFTRRAMT
jgi:hypothetical protein